jgi:hypothetical protein
MLDAGEMSGNSFIDRIGYPVVVPQIQKSSPAPDHVRAVTGFFGMLLVSKQEIEIPLTSRIKVVLIGALEAAAGAQQRLPANRTLQDGGHRLFLFQTRHVPANV